VTGTGDTPALGELNDLVGLLAVRIGAWNHFGYAAPESGQTAIPPLGERNAEAIRAGHGAIEVMDQISRELHGLRNQLISELRTDEDVRGRRVDRILAERRHGRGGQ
jgi:hypothetical protein